MKLKILTTDALALDEEVSSVTLPGTEGEMTILPHHTAMVATLKKGNLRYRHLHGKESKPIIIDEGVVEVYKDTVLILTKSLQIPEANPSHH
ncbi:MAG: ATP synthase F1 subunit epsilon [Deltaproteobacteria bacterium]|nr:ATP synthase F1 subunit epsilon [Deltaproteobacteria bacterium]MDZ4225131.1 ATP synthase F1 subunit epsilon [bacterium]